MSARLPRWPERLLARAVPDHERRVAILGDLREEYAQRPAGWRRSNAYALSCLWLSAQYGVTRLRRAPGRHSWSIESVRLDFAQAARSLTRSPGYLGACAASLTLGIAAATAIITIAYGALGRPLPFPKQDELLRFGSTFPASPPGSLSSMSPANFLDVARSARGFSAIGAYSLRRSVLITPALTERALGAVTTGNTLGLLGVAPIAGRLLGTDDDRPSSDPVVVIGESAWQRFFNRAPSAIGGTITIDLVPHTVVGVVPSALYLPGGPEFWTTFRWSAATAARRNRHDIEPIARLLPGVSFDHGRDELRRLGLQLAATYPADNSQRSIDAVRVSDWFDGSAGPSSQSVLRLISIGAAVILLVAMINVTTITLGRVEQRRRDATIHRALGSTTWRMRQRRAAEAVLLTCPGVVAGLGLAAWLVPAVLARFGDSVPRAATIRVDDFSVLLALACGLLSVLVIVGASSAMSDWTSLRSDTRTMTTGRPVVRRTLVALQVGLATTVLYGALVVGSTLWTLARVDLGVPVDRTIVFSVGLPAERFGQPADITRFFDTLESALRDLPGVEHVGITSRQPLSGGTNGLVSTMDGARALPIAEWRDVSPGFFDALGLRIMAGRNFSDVATAEADNVIVSETLARALFADLTPIGQSVRVDGLVAMHIVGVSADFRDFGPTRPPRPTIYFRHGSKPGFASIGTMNVIVRGGAPASAMVSMATTALRALDPAVPIDRPVTLASLAERAQGVSRRAAAAMLIAFTVIAVTLAGIGIAGVVAFNVQRRTREIGVRMALGSTSTAVLRSVLGEGVALTFAGAVAGAAGAWWINRLVTSVVIESARPHIASVLVVVMAILAAVAFLACAAPARRAARISVVDALRAE
jgi:predicted permease